MRYMATYDLMETVRNTNQWLGATARTAASYSEPGAAVDGCLGRGDRTHVRADGCEA